MAIVGSGVEPGMADVFARSLRTSTSSMKSMKST